MVSVATASWVSAVLREPGERRRTAEEAERASLEELLADIRASDPPDRAALDRTRRRARNRAALDVSEARREWRRRGGLARASALATGAPPFGRAAALASWSTEARERRAARRQARL